MRIAIAQLNYTIGDFKGNVEKITHIVQTHLDKADLIVFSELCLPGYYPKDLLFQEDFLDTQMLFLEKIKALTKETSIALVVGLIEKNQGHGKPYHNSLCLLAEGKTLFTYHKQLLPVYNIFDEARHFSPGNLPGLYTYQGIRLGFFICEDGWGGPDNFYTSDPIQALAENALDLIISLNGSPSNVGKQAERIARFGAIAKRCATPLVAVNQVGGNDDLVFDGASFLLDETGRPLGSLPSFEEATGTFSLQKHTLTIGTAFAPYLPLSPTPLFYQQIILGLKDYIRKCRFKKAIVGISGGIDSALTLALAVKALGCENITGIAMPSRYSSSHSLEDAKALCEVLKVTLYIASIEEEFTLCLRQFETTFGEKPASLTEQNMQARLRGRFLMAYANQTGALLLSTGNKSELSTGYTTLYGDMTGGLNLIGDLYKTEVYQVARYFNEKNPTIAIPLSILEKMPSAELAPDQKDTDSLPPYSILDPILKLYIEGDLLSPCERKTLEAIIAPLSSDAIIHIHHLVNKAEFKRHQAPPIIRVQRRAFGPGRLFPIAAVYQ